MDAQAHEESREMTRAAADDLMASLSRQAKLLDSAFRVPGLGLRVGYDSILGLIPGVGDAAGLVLSSALLYRVRNLGLSKWTWARMTFNIGLESLLGAVPLVGDFFDAWFKSNQRNVELIRNDLSRQNAQPKPRQITRKSPRALAQL